MNRKLDAIDILSILSFLISVENLDQNMTQNDKAELQNDLSEKADALLRGIHSHLELQDTKLNYIIRRLENDG